MIPFAKYHAAGNDFIVIDDIKEKFPIEKVADLCHRRLAIGADGVILLQPSEKADFRMRIFNADGKEAHQCGNGLRCLVDFIRQSRFATSPLTLETSDRIIECCWEDDLIRVNLGRYTWESDIDISPFLFHRIDTGVPHAVAFVENIEMADFPSLAPPLRSHPEFGMEGSNINIAELKNGKIYTRTFERGVAEETYACGTGAAAVAIAAQKKYQLPNPIQIIPLSREELRVEVNDENVHLIGKATFVFFGTILKS